MAAVRREKLLTLSYSVRESARAKRVRFQVSPADGLLIVVPKGFDRREIEGLIEANRSWIERAFERIEALRFSGDLQGIRPDEIHLAAIDRTWRVDWQETDEPGVVVAAPGPFDVRVSGSIGDRSAWRRALHAWLIERGREHLTGWTEEMARVLDVDLDRITVRCQKTRWGSYTSRPGMAGRISLNAQLLFLPYRLARYVILHELCHAAHPNHSPAFWEQVRRHEPESDRLRAELRRAWRHVPDWALSSS